MRVLLGVGLICPSGIKTSVQVLLELASEKWHRMVEAGPVGRGSLLAFVDSTSELVLQAV